MCKAYIDSYLPPHMMGNERWNDGVAEQLERDFRFELLEQMGFEL